MEFFKLNNVNFSYSYIDENFIDKNDITFNDIYGGADYLRDIEDVDISVFVKPKGKNCYKFSMRSNGKYDLTKISKLFDGGGHTFAAGFSVEAKDIFSAKDIFVNITEDDSIISVGFHFPVYTQEKLKKIALEQGKTMSKALIDIIDQAYELL